MSRWYSVQPVDESFLTTAPEIHRYVVDVPASPEQVWDSLQSDESLAAWGSAVKSVNWLTPRPFGVETRREVVLALGLIRVREQFLRWEDGRRYTFMATETSVPLFKHFAEDWLVEPHGTGARLTWIVAIESKLRRLDVVTGRVNQVAFGQMARSAKKFFAK